MARGSHGWVMVNSGIGYDSAMGRIQALQLMLVPMLVPVLWLVENHLQ